MSIENSEAVLDLGGVKITVGEMLEIINMERKKILEKYGVASVSEIPAAMAQGRLTIEEVLWIRHRLMVLDKMEEAIYEELFIYRGKLLNRLSDRLRSLLQLLGLRRPGEP